SSTVPRSLDPGSFLDEWRSVITCRGCFDMGTAAPDNCLAPVYLNLIIFHVPTEILAAVQEKVPVRSRR
ncbi:hypothetical protein GWI33_006885, partial [Rhynchophorus ferrugineus]